MNRGELPPIARGDIARRGEDIRKKAEQTLGRVLAAGVLGLSLVTGCAKEEGVFGVKVGPSAVCALKEYPIEIPPGAEAVVIGNSTLKIYENGEVEGLRLNINTGEVFVELTDVDNDGRKEFVSFYSRGNRKVVVTVTCSKSNNPRQK